MSVFFSGQMTLYISLSVCKGPNSNTIEPPRPRFGERESSDVPEPSRVNSAAMNAVKAEMARENPPRRPADTSGQEQHGVLTVRCVLLVLLAALVAKSSMVCLLFAVFCLCC